MSNTMMTYIKATPKRISYVTANSKKFTKKLVDLFLEKDYKRIWLVGCGSSYNGITCAKPFIEKYLDIDVNLITPNEFMYTNPRVRDDDFVLFFSQSGCSTNTIQAADMFKKTKHKTIGVTGNLKGDLKDHCDEVIDWMCGEETVGFVTIGLTILILFLMCFAKEAALRKGLISKKQYAELNKDFDLLPKIYNEIKSNTEKLIEHNKKEFTSISVMMSIGFAQGFTVSHEGALKTSETIKKPSLLYEGEEFAHGPNNALTPNTTCFFIDDETKGTKRILELYKATRCITDRAYIVTNSKLVDDKHAVRHKIVVKEKLLLPIYCLAFYQTIAYIVPEMLNGWGDHPLLKDFKKIASTKTSTISKVMPDYVQKKKGK